MSIIFAFEKVLSYQCQRRSLKIMPNCPGLRTSFGMGILRESPCYVDILHNCIAESYNPFQRYRHWQKIWYTKGKVFTVTIKLICISHNRRRPKLLASRYSMKMGKSEWHSTLRWQQGLPGMLFIWWESSDSRKHDP